MVNKNFGAVYTKSEFDMQNEWRKK